MRLNIFAFAFLSLSYFGLTACQPVKQTETPTIDETQLITSADIGRRIERLASDEFEGRQPSTEGGQKASQYIADEMRLAGLEPIGDNGTYFQNVELSESFTLPSSKLIINQDGEPYITADLSTNIVYWSKRLDDTIEVTDSEIIFVGYGINAPEYSWNDYADIDVKGKTVVMLVNDPGFVTEDDAVFKGKSMTYYGRWTYKFEEAGRQGAAAAIIIHQTAPASYGWGVVSGGWTGAQYDLVRPDGGASRTLVEGWVHEDTARKLFKGYDFSAEIAKAATPDFTPIKLEGLTLSSIIKQSVSTKNSPNVAGVIKGSESPDEYVLYMAHWDHLGRDEDAIGADKIYNGAVDNASGTAAIIEIAEAFALKGAPKRSAIFVAVTAEESGLLGSAYYADAPLVPLAQTVGGINIDAILPVGPTKDIKVIGYGASELEDLLKAEADKRDMYLVPDDKPEAGYYYRSDHISLAKKGVPMLYADPGNDHITKGITYGEDFAEQYTAERYHKPGDEYDNSWDLSGIEQTSRLLFDLGYNLANSDTWPNWYEGTEFRRLRDEMRP